MEREKTAFEIEAGGYTFRATYLNDGSGAARVEIEKDGAAVKEFLFPAYKIFNIAAHADDIAAGLDEDSERGLYAAGSDGLGGNVYAAA